jgi:PAS domain S-box-containing protein
MARILLVEDDRDLCAAMARTLRSEGYEVLEAHDGASCLKEARLFLPDLVILDVVLPDSEGTEVCSALKEIPELTGTHVLMISGVRLDPRDREYAFRGGADGYLVKPVEPGVLAARVEAALRRKEGEDRLRAQRDLMQKVIDSVPAPIFVKDMQGLYTHCNRAFEEYLGLGREEIIGSTVFDVAPPELAEIYHQADRRLMENPGRQEYGTQVRYADGSLHDVIFLKSTFQDLSGNTAGIVGVILDITGRKRAERELRRQRDRFENYLKVAGVMVVALDKRGRVALINPKGCELLGRREGEIVGKDWFEGFLPARVREEVRGIFRRLMEGDERGGEYAERPVLSASGEERIISWHNSLLRDEDGNIVGTLSSGEDITEMVRYRKELEELNLDLRQFASTLSHDLKSPLGNAYGWAVTFQRLYGEKLDETGRVALDSMVSSLREMDTLVEGMLSYVSMGRGKPELEESDLATLIKGLIDEMRENGELAGADVQIKEGMGKARCDRVRMRQAVKNLLGNASKFRHPRRALVVEIGIERSPLEEVLFVRDNGSGIQREDLERLFAPLERGGNVQGIPGHGLGLAIVKRAVESWGGRVWAESEPDRGATFYLSLPRDR